MREGGGPFAGVVKEETVGGRNEQTEIRKKMFRDTSLEKRGGSFGPDSRRGRST